MTRVVFMGTPDFAVPSLNALVGHPDFEIVGVVTQPDRPAGRGQQVHQSAVKHAAEKHSLPVFQPETLRDSHAITALAEFEPQLIVVVAFGQILRSPVLDLSPWGCVNVHASLLPRWRGAAPIQYAVRAGDERSGVTIMKMDAGLDTGPILAQRAVELSADETGASLHDKLSQLGALILPATLSAYLRGEIEPQPQPESGVSLARSLKKEEGKINWAQPAATIDRQVRAFQPWPGTFTYLDTSYLKVHRGGPVVSDHAPATIGTLLRQGDDLVVQTGDGLYRLDEIQPAGKQRMAANAFLAGHADIIGKILGNE